jgi:invasion protein IalB
MSKFMTALPLCAALALTAPITVFAQTATDTTTSETAAPETAAEESGTQAEEPKPQPGTSGNAGQIEEQLSLGEDADKDPELGKPYTKKEIGSWEMRCIKTEEEVDPCQMYQLLADGEGAPVAEVSLFRWPGGGQAKAGATVVVPLETALPAQLTLSVDGGKARRYPYAFCNPVGCYVRMGLTDADIAAFKRGKQAVLTIVPALAPDQEVKLTLSLDGFTAGYDEVSVIEQ